MYSVYISIFKLHVLGSVGAGKVQTLDWTTGLDYWNGLLDWHILVFNFISYILWYRVVQFY